jgi:hypothetical protein
MTHTAATRANMMNKKKTGFGFEDWILDLASLMQIQPVAASAFE